MPNEFTLPSWRNSTAEARDLNMLHPQKPIESAIMYLIVGIDPKTNRLFTHKYTAQDYQELGEPWGIPMNIYYCHCQELQIIKIKG